MKTTDFLDFFEFETNLSDKRTRIRSNQCSVLVNKKNQTYYFRFEGFKYKFLKIGKAQGAIFFVLNNDSGIKSSNSSGRGKTIAYYSQQAVTTMLTLLDADFKNQPNYRCLFDFEIVSENDNEKVLRFREKI